MKYSSDNPPLVCMHTQCKGFNNSRRAPKGILWHDTGACNTDLCRYVQPFDNTDTKEDSRNSYTNKTWIEKLGKNKYNNHWNKSDRVESVNAWIGKLADGTITTVQVLTWDRTPNGCGSGSVGSCNGNAEIGGFVQFEICDDSKKDSNNKCDYSKGSDDYFNKVYQEACELTAYLCKMYNIDPKGTVTHCGVSNVPTITCHQEAHKLGLASDHGDVLKWFKAKGKTMEDVRNDVAKILNDSPNTPVEPDLPQDTPTTPTPPTETPTTPSWIKTSQIVEYGNKWYIRDDEGGYSTSSYKGSLYSKGDMRGREGANVLSNCTGFANGAYNETFYNNMIKSHPDMEEKQYFKFSCNPNQIIKRATEEILQHKAITEGYVDKDYFLNNCVITDIKNGMPPLGGLIMWDEHIAYISKIIDSDTIEIMQSSWTNPWWDEEEKNEYGTVTGYKVAVGKCNRTGGWKYPVYNNDRSFKGYAGEECLGFIANPAVTLSYPTDIPVIRSVTQELPLILCVEGSRNASSTSIIRTDIYYKWGDNGVTTEEEGHNGKVSTSDKDFKVRIPHPLMYNTISILPVNVNGDETINGYVNTYSFVSSKPASGIKTSDGEVKSSIPYIYKDSKWKLSVPIIRHDNEWRASISDGNSKVVE